MTMQGIETLHKEGWDIKAKSLNHKDLTKLSANDLDFEVGESKSCLDNHNIDARVFSQSLWYTPGLFSCTIYLIGSSYCIG